MKVETKNNEIVISYIGNGITVENKEGKELKIREKDNGFEIKFGNGKWNLIDDETDIVMNKPDYIEVNNSTKDIVYIQH